MNMYYKNDKIVINAIKDGKILFKNPYIAHIHRIEMPELIKDQFAVIDTDLNIRIIADSEEELREQLIEEFDMLFDEYALEQDYNLTQDAINLKRKLLSMLVINENTHIEITSDQALKRLIDETYLLLPENIRQELFQAIRKDLDELKLLKEKMDSKEEINDNNSTNYNYAEKYIKKPVVVEAFHYRRYYTDYRDLESFCGDSLIGVDERISPIIKTLEGEVSLYDDCYVIKGIKGEFYPCQKEIFYQSYNKCKD